MSTSLLTSFIAFELHFLQVVFCSHIFYYAKLAVPYFKLTKKMNVWQCYGKLVLRSMKCHMVHNYEMSYGA